ncbi:MAG: hypothetical protein IJX06_00310 [Clostridia bacterium]|nr:hypothetical protein [Clostridia bacterium]
MILDVKTINSLEKVFPYIEPKGEQKSASIFRNDRFNFRWLSFRNSVALKRRLR